MPSTPPPRAANASWPLEVHGLGPVACGAVGWRYRGQLQVTAIVKATFTLVPGGAMTTATPDEVRAGDVHFDGDPRRSVHAASDLTPYRAQADVVLTGHAWWRPGEGPRGTALRLAVLREQVLIDKTIYLVDPTGAATAPFQVPLVHEHATGGPGTDNPVGSQGRPHLVDLDDPRRSACFAPIPRAWPVRERLLGGLDPRGLERPILELPPELDWTFFQAAPADQRADFLRGDEWILLKGLHPTLGMVKTQLPGVRGFGQVYGLSGKGARPIAMNADTLAIDVDRQCCSITWRANFPVPSEDALPLLRVAVGVELPGQPRMEGAPASGASRGAGSPSGAGAGPVVAVRARAPIAAGSAPPAAGGPGSGSARGGGRKGKTVVLRTMAEVEQTTEAPGLEVESVLHDPRAAIAPFPLASPGEARAGAGQIPGAPWAGARAPLAPEVTDPMMGTMVIAAPPELRAAFARDRAAEAPARAPASAEPPAAWLPPAMVAAPAVVGDPASVGAPATVTEDGTTTEPLAPGLHVAPEVPRYEAPAAEAPPPPKAREAVWAQPLPEREPAQRPAPQRAPATPSPEVKSSLYGKFGPKKR